MAYAQSETIPFNTDRPDQSNTPWLVPGGTLQLETGFVMEKDYSNTYRVTNYSLTNTLLKYGINEFCEIRVRADYLNTHNHNTGYNINGFNALAIGLKIKLANKRGYLPQAALVAHLTLKSEDQYYTPDNSAMDITLCFTHDLSSNWSISHNWGTEWDGEKPEMIFYNTLSVGYNFNKLGLFLENYNFYQSEKGPDFRLDGGIMYDLKPNIKLDVSGGIGLSESSPDYFISAGISLRFLRSGVKNKLNQLGNIIRSYNINL